MTGRREIAFDTETTGFDANGEDRITEIGCVELVDLIPTGREWHSYVNPERDIPERVTEITGLTQAFLQDKPLFHEIAEDFLDFVGDHPLVAHNAGFDRSFINAELQRAQYQPLPTPRFIDTLVLAREKFPGARNTLDALCQRFEISLASRSKHGALVDAHLLAKVYLELKGGKARTLDLQSDQGDVESIISAVRKRKTPLAPLLSEEEKAQHDIFIKNVLGEKALWNRDL